MQKLGYLDTWRRPKDVGRPEKLYRITQKLDPLFPRIEDDVTLSLLDAAAQLDRNAAEKLLFAFFRNQTEKIAKVVTGNSVQERAERLADVRLKMGYFSKCTYSEEEGLRIEEFHNPLRSLFEKYSTMERIEAQMFERLLGARVVRSEDSSSGLNRYRFDLSPR